MRTFGKYLLFAIIFGSICFFSCSKYVINTNNQGVSEELAKQRKSLLSEISYILHFDIPESREEPVEASLDLSFKLENITNVLLDFKAQREQIHGIFVNGAETSIQFENEHITIPKRKLQKGENRVEIAFTAGDLSLNRNEDYLYTLLVPDRARTLFPCFDQPDLKANYSLSLSLPREWKAVANGKIVRTIELENRFGAPRMRVDFAPTEPLSTYLFSFVAGKMQQKEYEREGRAISIYHRETEAAKMAQIDKIADQIYFCLHWMEEYTHIPYPFAKYDAIILPGFQYGGMEHAGATLYNDKRLILGEHPTTEEELARTELIAHETAHMWFGDYVTMKWFDDVWTKEVFAGYFAAKMSEPLFPHVNHKLNALKQFFPPAYSEDRSPGSTAIKHPLENLQDAGLIYGKIIYNKAPVVMNMLANKLGDEAFRLGLQEYLRTYANGNADWTELIGILDEYTPEDLANWSRVWVQEKGMPEYILSAGANGIQEQVVDPDSLGRVWQQPLKHWMTPEGFIVPNIDGSGYGFFRLDTESLRYNMEHLADFEDPVTRLSVLINVHEHLARRYLQPAALVPALLSCLPHEDNVQIFSSLLTYLYAACKIDPGMTPSVEEALRSIKKTNKKQEFKQLIFNSMIDKAGTPASAAELYAVWSGQAVDRDISVSENQYMTLAYELALRLPEKADSIIRTQMMRLTHPDKIREFAFIAPAVSPRKTVRDSLFKALLHAGNRRVEPWAVRALRYLNHPLRQADALDYILPGLEILPEIQRTGDIFLPANWCAALLEGHTSAAAARRLRDFLEEHQDMPALLKNKVLQSGDWLLRLKNAPPVLHGQITYFREKNGLYQMLPITDSDIVLVGDDFIDRGEWAHFFGDKRVKNRGIALESTDCTLFRIESIAKEKPRKIFLHTGLYDIKRGRPARLVWEAILEITERIRSLAPDCEVFVLGIVPDTKIWETETAKVTVEEVNNALKLRSSAGLYTYIDLPSILCDGSGRLEPAYTFNGINLNGAGYAVFAKTLAPYIGLEALNQQHDKEYPGKSGYYLHRVSILNSLPLQSDGILMLGNSLTNIGRWDEFFPELPIQNYGISGDGTQGVLQRLKDVIAQKPSKLFLMMGINDFINDPACTVGQVWSNYQKIIQKLRTELPETELYIQSTLPLHPMTKFYPGRNAKVQLLNQHLKQAAAELDYHYLDVASLFKDHNGDLGAEYTCDGIHLMANGYEKWRAFLREEALGDKH